MEQELSNKTTILLVYIFIFTKYLFFSNSFFDVQFLISTMLVVLLTWMNIVSDKLSNEAKNIGKFLGHSMFLSICFSLVCGFISIIYNIIFYFGFVNTIIIGNIVCMMLMSGLVKLFKEEILLYLTKFTIGNKILDLMNYYYNTYIISKKLYEKTLEFIGYIFKKYIWEYSKIVFRKFMKINNELCDNDQSILVKKKLDNKCSNTKNYVIEQIVQPYFIESFQNALTNNPFLLLNQNNKNQYKNSLVNQNINMNFLKNNKIESQDDINDNNVDDLDVEPDLSNVLKVSSKQIEEAEKLDENKSEIPSLSTSSDDSLMPNKDSENSNSSNMSTTPKLSTPEERKEAYRKAMARKKASRNTGSRNQNSMQQNMANIMNIPGMNKMMDTMLQGNNLEKLMKQIPPGTMGGSAPAVSVDQMKQLIGAMNKNN